MQRALHLGRGDGANVPARSHPMADCVLIISIIYATGLVYAFLMTVNLPQDEEEDP